VTAALLLAGALSNLEGQVVASVAVDAPPGDAARLGRLVELRAGEPYSQDAVRHALELLHATGEFEDVVVEAESSAAGLALVFRPKPAPLLLRVLREGDPVLDPEELRRVARLREREALWPARLERAGRDVALHLSREGYLEACVEVAARRRAGGADAAFRVHAGPRARVGQASVSESAGAQRSTLLALVRPRPGEVYRREAAQDAAEQMRRRLAAAGFWRAEVAVRDAYDPSRARVALAFAVAAGRRTSLRFEGDRPGAGPEARIERLVREGAAKPDALEDATDRIEGEFQRRGHRTALTQYREESGPEADRIVFTTRAGPAAQVASVTVAGAGGLEAIPRLRPGAALEDRVLDEDVRALRRALEDDGYAGAVVEVEVPEGGGQVPVLYRVRPGPRSVVSSFELEAPGPIPAAASARELRTRAGIVYRARHLAQDRADLLSAYRDAGYLDAEVFPELSFSADRSELAVRLRVVPGERTEVEHVVIGGLAQTREQVVRRELLLEQGQPLGLGPLLESQRRLQALGLFESVSVSELDPESAGRRSLLVAAREGPRTSLAYGVGYAERELLRGSVEVTRRNLSGMDRSVTAFVRASFRGSRLFATYREPFLFGRKQGLFVTAFREEEDREGFDYVRYGGIVQTAQKLSRDWSLILRGSYQLTSVFNVEVDLSEVDRQYRDSTSAGPSASVVKDTRDDPLDPHRGHFLGGDFQISSPLFGGDSFMKAFLQASAFDRVTPRATLALSARVGLAGTYRTPVPARLPLPERFFAGGDYSIRGFETDHVGPLEPTESDPETLVPTGGNALLVGNAELRLEAARHVSLALFTDAGNVYPLVSDIDLGDVRYSAGLGVRYLSALGPIRVDLGFKLNPREGESRSHFHLTIGHAF
jgi:outer membrane protein insertion porin family